MNQYYDVTEIQRIAEAVLKNAVVSEEATVIALQGDLGAGKTTLTQCIARLLGITETLASPTFVVAKFYTPSKGGFERMVHMDAYRIEDEAELVPLNFAQLLKMPKTLIVIEWPENVQHSIPSDTAWYVIEHAADKRHIQEKKNREVT